MANILGIDIGEDRLKLVLSNGKKIKSAVVVDMPENIVRNGVVVSQETMGEFLRETIKEHRMSAPAAAVVFFGERVYIRNVTMPLMNATQLVYNLPYEFRDYITEELKDYVFDYAVESINEEEKTMEVLAAATPREMVEDYRAILRKAGLKMKKAAPLVCAYQALIRSHEKYLAKNEPGDYCILDLGYSHTRMDVFCGTHYSTTNELEVGISGIVDVIAESMGVDAHIAKTYLMTNHQACQESETCKNAYENMSVELMRTMNFLRYSNPDSNFEKIYLCGGGAAIAPLRASLEESLEMEIKSAWELLPEGGGIGKEEGAALAVAAGILEDMK